MSRESLLNQQGIKEMPLNYFCNVNTVVNYYQIWASATKLPRSPILYIYILLCSIYIYTNKSGLKVASEKMLRY